MRDDDVGPARNDFKLPASSAQKLTGALAFKKLGQRQGSLTFDVHEADHAPVYIDLSQMSNPTSTQMSNPTSTQMSNPTSTQMSNPTSSNQETESSETNQSNNQAMTGGAPGQVDNADDKNSSDRNDGNSDNESDSGNELDASEDEPGLPSGQRLYIDGRSQTSRAE